MNSRKSPFQASFFLNFNRVSCKVKSKDPHQKPHYAVSDLGLHCLPLSRKKNVRLTRVKTDVFLVYRLKTSKIIGLNFTKLTEMKKNK